MTATDSVSYGLALVNAAEASAALGQVRMGLARADDDLDYQTAIDRLESVIRYLSTAKTYAIQAQIHLRDVQRQDAQGSASP